MFLIPGHDQTPYNGFYKNRHVCVLGGAGFVGVQLVRLLLEAGARVDVVDNESRGHNHVDGVRYFNIDAGHPESLWYTIGRTATDGPFAIFNLAAKVAGVLYNSTHHHEMFLENARLQTVPLQVAEECNRPHFLQVSSTCVYSPDHNHPCLEQNGTVGEPHAANAGYAWAKRMGEQAVGWSKLEHAVIVRPQNVFGPHDYFDQESAHVIPNLIRKCLDPQLPELLMRTAPTVSREFIFSRDVAAGMMHALAYGGHQEAYNLGTNGQNLATMAELIAAIQSLAGTHKPVIWQPSSGVDTGDPARWSDSSKLNQLGWTHQVSLVAGLKETIQWYKNQKGL